MYYGSTSGSKIFLRREEDDTFYLPSSVLREMFLCFVGISLCFLHIATSHDLEPFSTISFGAFLSKFDEFVASFTSYPTSRSNRL